MQAEIIAIGDEILIGQTIDTNSGFIGSQLSALGISILQRRVIADDADSIRHALDTLHPDSRLVFMTGGLGPTKDDITKQSLIDYFGGELVMDQAVLKNIESLFASFRRKPRESNRQQALVPSSCEVIYNEIGTAPGMRFHKEGVYFFSTPGVPYETEYLVEQKIIPWIVEQIPRGSIYHKSLLTQGVPESELADQLEEIENSLPSAVKLAYLPSPGMVRLRLSGYAPTAEESRELVLQQAQRLRDVLGLTIFGEDRQTLPEVLGQVLLERKFTMAAAESCTGGYLAHLVTSEAGCSRYFLGSAVTYSNQSKQEALAVNGATLQEHGAVSEATVREMAEGARKHFHADFAVATSGVAGPSGGTESRPVGLVWIAVAGPDETRAYHFHFGRDRARNIRRASFMALDLLRRMIQKYPV